MRLDLRSSKLPNSARFGSVVMLFACVLTAAGLLAPQSRAPVNSPLWGHEGERWQPEKTLPDFSYAGYRANEVSIPSAPATWNLKQDFHAIGDGKTDDSNAFERAFAAGPGVCYVPAGKYLISRPLHLTHGNFVLRGDGAGRTVLFFPKP